MEKTELKRDEFFQELQRIRESKGLRLEDISRRFKIRLSFLESIESGTFEDLPEPVYTKTFIKTYAGLLETDAAPILARYSKYIEKTIPAPQPEPPKEQNLEPRTEVAVFDWLGKQGSKIGWAVVAVTVVILLGIYVFQDSGEKPTPPKTIAREAVKPPEKTPETPPAEQTPAPQPETAPPQQAAAQSPTPQQAPTQAAAPQPAPVQSAAPEAKKPEAPPPAEKKPLPPPTAPVPGALSLKIDATEAAWVQVRADKAPPVQKLMQAGETLTTEAKEKITVDLGNAGGVQITFQGQSMGSPGKRGEVVRMVYPEGKRVEKKKPEEPKPATQPATE